MENCEQEARLVNKQAIILGLTSALMIFGFLAIALNIRSIMEMEHHVIAVAIAQMPAALGGAWLGLELMWAGRKEGLSKD